VPNQQAVQAIVGPAAEDRRQAACCAVLASSCGLGHPGLCGQGSCNEADNTHDPCRGGGSLHSYYCAARHRPRQAQPGGASVAAAPRPPLLVLGTGRYRAACTCSHMDTRHALHCSSRLVGAAHLARRGGAAAATAQLTAAGQLLHPRCGSPPRSPDRPIVDCRTQVHAHARHASSRSSCPKVAGRRPPPRTVPRRLPATSDPDRGTKSCVAARRAPRQGRRASLPAVRRQRCMHDPCMHDPCQQRLQTWGC
jgi:hypothetical protein